MSKFKVGDRVFNPQYWPNPETIQRIVYKADESENQIWVKESGTWLPERMVQLFEPKGLTPGVVQQAPKAQVQSNGGPSPFYDFLEGWSTLNDLIESKSSNQWLEHSFHLANIVKAATRWGDKAGVTKDYDARKIIYSATRVLKMLIGVEKTRQYLNELLNDRQFRN